MSHSCYSPNLTLSIHWHTGTLPPRIRSRFLVAMGWPREEKRMWGGKAYLHKVRSPGGCFCTKDRDGGTTYLVKGFWRCFWIKNHDKKLPVWTYKAYL